MNLLAQALVLEQLSTWHVGQQYGISAALLAVRANCSEREVRHAVSALREDGVGVCAHPTTGYFMAANDTELQEFCIDFLTHRAMHSLRIAARLKKIALPDLVGQLKLES